MENDGSVLLLREEQTPKHRAQNSIAIGQLILFLLVGTAITGGSLLWMMAGNLQGIVLLFGGSYWLWVGLRLLQWHLEYLNTILVVEVRSTGIFLRYYAKTSERLNLNRFDIKSYAIGSSPLGYAPGQISGWWGRVFGFGGKGISVELKDGKRVFVGSKNPLQLIAALDQMKQLPSPPPVTLNRYPPE